MVASDRSGSQIFDHLGLRRVINARSHVTALGASLMSERAAEAMADAARSYVIMAELRKRAGEAIAAFTGAEAGCVTAGAAAGIAMASAACMTGTDPFRVEQLPDSSGMRNEFLVQIGHMVEYLQQIRLAGGKVVPVGQVWRAKPSHILGAINERTAAVFYVVSHHCSTKGMLSVEEVIELAHSRDIPVIVDAAAELDPRKYAAAGADLVAYSGGKYFQGPMSVGILCGRRDLITACEMQMDGIARGMKVCKEEIAALLVTMEEYAAADHGARWQRWRAIADRIARGLQGIPHVEVSVRPEYPNGLDPEGRPYLLVHLLLDEVALGRKASDVYRALVKGDPSIHIRDHLSNLQVLQVDVTCLLDGEDEIVVERLRVELGAD